MKIIDMLELFVPKRSRDGRLAEWMNFSVVSRKPIQRIKKKERVINYKLDDLVCSLPTRINEKPLSLINSLSTCTFS